MDEIFNETAILDAIEGGYDALIVEVDITTSENRNKRQASGKMNWDHSSMIATINSIQFSLNRKRSAKIIGILWQALRWIQSTEF